MDHLPHFLLILLSHNGQLDEFVSAVLLGEHAAVGAKRLLAGAAVVGFIQLMLRAVQVGFLDVR